jgi:monoamine oxidase
VLVTFLEGHDARALSGRPAAERRAAVLDSLARYFGNRVKQPTHYVEMDWLKERWSGGCYVGITAPGVLLDFGATLRRPVGRIHWAGTETAIKGIGYMDGAVESGQRAANEVKARL